MSRANQPDSDDDDDEDDYMKMTFADAPATTMPETSLQRRQREKREAEIRGRVKSKAELAAEEEAKRETALSKSLLADPAVAKKSKGLAMMAKMGFTGGALGSKDSAHTARTEPIKIFVKDGREGIGLESERKRKLREAAEAAGEAAKKVKVDESEYRERMRREREEARHEKQLHAAQKVAEMMDEEKGIAPSVVAHDTAEKQSPPPPPPPGDQDKTTGEATSVDKKRPSSSRPLKSIPVIYRGLVRSREEAERNRRMRHDLEQSSSSGGGGLLARLPTFEDPEEDADDRKALGKTAAITYVTADDLDDEDEELNAFSALDAAEKLRHVVLYLREKHKYCFWCKFAYLDAEMDGCPGVEEEDHD
ncbi:G-patch domain-containing protein [Apodospora peruviana]|uniref:G-patch domain-containing protein n=1 Tax=Apodospora peruviana TaxID=516989 RepID=A0AAE0MFC0_9PEZI|nr:G-patch domain-containing protein [Apodospora peruviana]